ncbi:MAG: YceI family protein [Corynebacteriales bacterium]|nr:YceI family protein [Mycobacteriales bacterium]
MTQALAINVPAEVTPGQWEVDPMHSEISFTIRHLMSKVRGRFDEYTSKVVIDGSEPLSSTVEVEIAMASINTNNEMRDNHVRGDAFNVEKYPTMTFRSTGIRTIDDEEFWLDGELTILGNARPVSLKAEFLGVGSGLHGETRIGFSAKTAISRKEFGMDFNIPLPGGDKVVLSDEVKIALDLQLVKSEIA